MGRSNVTFRALVAGLCALLAGCGTSGSASSGPAAAEPEAAPAATSILVLYRNRCGACHRPVAPRSEPAGQLHAALLEHRKRVRLTQQQWAGIEAFLAPPGTPH